jgi:hypothetical protein
MVVLHPLPALNTKCYRGIKIEFRVLDPPTTLATAAERTCHQPIQRVIDFA